MEKYINLKIKTKDKKGEWSHYINTEEDCLISFARFGEIERITPLTFIFPDFYVIKRKINLSFIEELERFLKPNKPKGTNGKINNRWYDENHNSWSSIKNTEKQAEQKSKTLVKCYNCHDCEDCYDCRFCFTCLNCSRCSDCSGCSNKRDTSK